MVLEVIHAVAHNVQLLRPLVQLPRQVIAPAFLATARTSLLQSLLSLSGPGRPLLRGGSGNHPLGRRSVGPADQQIQVRRRYVLHAADPLQGADGRPRRHGEVRVDDPVGVVVERASAAAAVPGGQDGEFRGPCPAEDVASLCDERRRGAGRVEGFEGRPSDLFEAGKGEGARLLAEDADEGVAAELVVYHGCRVAEDVVEGFAGAFLRGGFEEAAFGLCYWDIC